MHSWRVIMEKEKTKIFDNFQEFWRYTKFLEDFQRKIIFSSLSAEDQERIESSYRAGGWDDLFHRNKLDDALNEIKKDLEVDMLFVRAKVLGGKSHYIKKSQWDYINDFLNTVSSGKHLDYIFGGIEAVEEYPGVILLTSSN